MTNIAENFPDISFIDDTMVEDVLSQMISDYQEKYEEITGKSVSLGQADPYRLIMYACTMQIYQAMQYVDYAGKMSFLKYANGDYLDNLAAIRGISRIEATAASTVLEFSIESAIASAVSIPAGTQVTNGNDVYFVTDEYAEIAAGETTTTVTATCSEAGTSGNDFDIGEINIVVTTLPYIVQVTNTVKTYGGADTEDDDTLRDQIYNVPASYSTAGSKEAYEYHTKLVDSSISDVLVKSDIPGQVDVYVICEDGELPSDALLAEIETYLSGDTIRPLTDTVTVQAPDTVDYDIEFTYYIASSSSSATTSIQEEVEAGVSAYTMWQSEKIGRDINPSYLTQMIMDAGAKRVVVTSPEFKVLEESEIAQLASTNIIYGGVEDD